MEKKEEEKKEVVSSIEFFSTRNANYDTENLLHNVELLQETDTAFKIKFNNLTDDDILFFKEWDANHIRENNPENVSEENALSEEDYRKNATLIIPSKGIHKRYNHVYVAFLSDLHSKNEIIFSYSSID